MTSLDDTTTSPDTVSRSRLAGLRRTAAGPGRKIVVIASLVLATMIPGWLIEDLIAEREARQGEVEGEMMGSWGPRQDLRTPILVVPVDTVAGQDPLYLRIAPSRLQLATELRPEERRRGLFAATVFEARLAMQGRFDLPAPERLDEVLGGRAALLQWDRAFLMASASSLAGMRPDDAVTWDGKPLVWQNCREVLGRDETCRNTAAVMARLALSPPQGADTPVAFQAALSLRGTSALRLWFQGRELEAELKAPWASPSFTGSLLPTRRAVTDDAFTAEWQAVDYTAPRLWTTRNAILNDSAVTTLGVELIAAVPTYRMVSRAAKYALLFVVLGFTTYFLFELLSGVRIHMIQYGLLGLSLSLFPLLLLSFSEPLGYGLGYGVAALPVLLQASAYTAAVVRRTRPTLVFATLLAGLFGFLYVLLSLESYSLMLGSVALFLALSAVMMLTQRVDWSGSATRHTAVANGA